MPDLGISEILAIAGLITSAGGAAYSGYQASQQGGPSTAQNQAAAAASAAQAQQAAAQKQNAINANISNAQEKTGGALGAEGLTNLASLLAGYGGSSGGGTNPAVSVGAGGAPSGPGLQDALTQLTSGGGGATPSNFTGGGSSPTPDTPAQQLASPFAGA